jgi:LacI family transcriptional regulator, galactose operon repressor
MSTIREVAQRAGVSVATVSYVLNDARKVRPETEQRVLLAAKELGYSPNTAARSLVVGRSSMVGLVIPDIENPFFPEITKAFQEAAAMAGLETIVMNTNYDAQRTRSMVDRLASLQVPGAAFLTSQVDPPVREALAKRGICGVYLEHDVTAEHISNIAIDYGHGIAEAVKHLADLGHRRVGLIGGPAHGSSARRRKNAFLECADTAGLETRVLDSDFTVQGGYFSCARLLNRFAATAIMAANDLMAIGAMHFAYDRQVRVPADLSVVGFDDITFAQFTQPALTTVNVPRVEIGRLAFQALNALITDRQSGGKQYEVKTSLVIRQTTAPPAESLI